MRQRLLLHIGLHKTGTTFLQRKIWPAWQGVSYAGRPNPPGYRSSEDAVFDLPGPVLLMSNESAGGSLKQSYLPGRSWAESHRKKLVELQTRYGDHYDLGVLIGLRRPDAWVLSIYKHYLKYGGVEDLDGFLGLKAGTPATLPAEEFRILPKLRRIREILGVDPCCFLLEEFVARPAALSEALARYAQVERGPVFESSSVLNEGVNQAEAAFCFGFNRRLINRGCLGQGAIRRNKTLAFDLARKLGRRGWFKRDAEPLTLTPAAKAFIHEELAADWSETLAWIAGSRGEPVSELHRVAGLDRSEPG